jgi:hypothetical protein
LVATLRVNQTVTVVVEITNQLADLLPQHWRRPVSCPPGTR